MDNTKEKLLKEAYDRFIQTSLNDLPLQGIEEFVDKDIMGYGTTLDEKCLSIKDYRELIEKQREQGKDIEMTFDTTQVYRRISEDGYSALYVDEILISLHLENNPFDMFLRISTVLEYHEGKWIVVHWHGSKPEYEEGGKDTWHIDEQMAKTEKLEKEVAEKTADLLTKNRELEIEASLERVRAVAMGMNKSDDLLNISESLFKELISLGFTELRNAMINIHNDDKKTFLNYDYSDEIGRSITPLFYNIHPVIAKQIKQIRSADDAFSETVFEGNDLEGWKEFRKSRGEKDDPRIDSSSALYYYFYSIGSGSIGISTFSPIGEEKLALLKRFRNTFKLSYQRYKDIKQAEAQAREADIQLALERVRSRSMSMIRSEDLLSICETSFQEFKRLGFDNLRNAIIHIFNDEKNFFMDYDYSELLGGEITKINYESHPVVENYLKHIKNAKDDFVEVVIDGEQLDGWKQFRKKGGQKDDPRLNKINALYYYFYSIDTGSIGISNFEAFTEDQLNILKRFRNVFDLAYRRYTDIAQAEAQAREAEIQLALERVRARTMAMQKSDELAETAYVLYEQFGLLGENPEQLTIGIVDETNKIWEFWLTVGGNQVNHVFKAPIKEPIVLNKSYIAWKEGKKSMVIDISGDELQAYYNFFKSLPDYEEYNEYRNSQSTEQRRVIHYAFFSKGSLSLASPEPKPAETIQLLERFAGVLEQTYTRFLDLQKSETQARESQIQLALEKVRMVALGLNKSEEMLKVAKALYEQLLELGFSQIRNAIIDIKNGDDDTFTDYDYSHEMSGTITQMSYHDDPTLKGQFKKMATTTDDFFELVLEGKELEDLKAMRIKNGEDEDPRLLDVDLLTYNLYSFGNGAIGISNFGLLSAEEKSILNRFSNVFTFAYKRYNDLASAEAQARETQIQLALERVRARTMAMHKSDELAETAKVLFQQFSELGENPDQLSIVIVNEKDKVLEMWLSVQGLQMDRMFRVPVNEPVVINKIYDAWKKRQKSLVLDISGKELKRYNDFRNSMPEFKDYNEIKNKQSKEENRRVMYNAFFPRGLLSLATPEPRPDETLKLLERFAGVFDLTYTRFLDLQKAESQAREAQMEAALERVRSLALGMHKSIEVGKVTDGLFAEFNNLSVDVIGCSIVVIDEEQDTMELWRARSNLIVKPFESSSFDKSMNILKKYMPDWFPKFYNALGERKKYLIEEMSTKNRDQFLKAIAEQYDYSNDEKSKLLEITPKGFFAHFVFFKLGYLALMTEVKLSDEELSLARRFMEVFDFAYTRFWDISKAEAQAREAQIEMALERVRSRTMAMQHSDELADTAGVLFEQFVLLGINPKRCVIGIIDQTKESAKLWFTSSEGKVVPGADFVPLNEQENLIGLYQAWKNYEQNFYFKVQGQKRVEWTSYMIDKVKMHLPEYQPETIDRELISNEPAIFNSFFFTHGFVMLHTAEELQEPDMPMLKRFAGVFEQTYTRFLDLKNAEAQARESMIEAALERVRARAMSMHTSDDLSETVSLFFKELKSLNVLPWRCGVGRIDEETRTTYLTTTSKTKDGEIKEVTGKLKQTGHPVLDGIFDNWKLQKEYFPVLRGDDINKYYSIIKPQIAYPDYPLDAVQYGHNIPFKEGFIFAWTENKLSEDELQIFRRFSSVLSLTYRRFMDLKEAEVRAIESVRQAALDRVRAEIASMRTSEDLNRITPIIWRELKTLEVPFIRCGVFIINEENEKVHVYLTTPDGKALGVLDLSFDATKLIINTVESWRKAQVYKEHWNKEQFIKWTKSMMELGQVQDAETYQGSSTPPESLNLHFVPFTQGMLYVGDVSPLTDEKLELVKTLAEAFSIAYARYEDFKQLEDAKNKIEITLDELKAAQAQLVHSEKMASLGELTAGIAHEIKNPLNFVNNFSEVSSELLEEMKTELQNKNEEEVTELIEDLKQNLEKISQHGKRADSIVKGMLLHSRGTSGEKTLTDINDLLDQYVNLAYHGMRAQNKEFNIAIEKNYDESLEKINVVPQDISRVFLNIINNACYAAYDKKRNSADNFSPTLKVSTKKMDGKVEIRIGDNGYGISKDIIDKIFQPFFTTKPSGEGTGLGLSLSYDIITKVHSGDLKVETNEGEGTVFIISLKP